MMTGEPPNFRLSTMQALFNIVEEDHPPIPAGFSEALVHLLVKCCFVKNPKVRPSAEELLGHPWVKASESIAKPNFAQLKASLKTNTEKHEAGNDTKDRRVSHGTRRGRGAVILAGQSVEELEALLDDVTRERDAIKAENADLKRQIEAFGAQ